MGTAIVPIGISLLHVQLPHDVQHCPQTAK